MIAAGVLGATGYTGQELVRLLAQHPDVELKMASSQSYGGKQLTDVFPHLKGQLQIVCEETDIQKMANECDVIFAALPHGVTAKVVTANITSKTKVIDLGADFRLRDVTQYEQWYHTSHANPALVSHAVYGLSEWNEQKIVSTNLVANPGCYATASALALLPLVAGGLIEPQSIIIDAKSGVSGAGRTTTQDIHFNECNETIKAYGVGSHRHTPEIEQTLASHASGSASFTITFTPHLVPMNRGILVTAYGAITNRHGIDDINHAFRSSYDRKPFIRLLTGGEDKPVMPETRWVKGSNFCDIGWTVDERTNRVIVVAALDNLVKGAAGQAIQNMNIMFGINQQRGLNYVPIFPA